MWRKETNIATDNQAQTNERRTLPRRDFILLPALSLFTAIVLLSFAEIFAHSVWPEQTEDACRIVVAGQGSRFRPNCKSSMKLPESQWIENAYNDCGFRTQESCSTAPRGTMRVAVLGTSFSYGYMNAYRDAYTTLTANSLAHQCHRPVEFQNLGVPNLSLLGIYRRFDDALELKPNLILLSLTAMDFRVDIDAEALARRDQPVTETKDTAPEVKASWIKLKLVEPLKHSRALYMLQHFLYQDPDTYANLYLLYGDTVGYLRDSPSKLWQQRLHDFDVVIGSMAVKAHTANVPLVLFLGAVPAQVALQHRPARPGYDALNFNHELATIALQHGVATIDALSETKSVQNPMHLFYVVDAHLNASGEQLLATSLEKGLRSEPSSPFATCGQAPAAQNYGSHD